MRKFRLILTVALALWASQVYAQITIEECYDRAMVNYPLVRNYDLINKSEGYDLKNASKAWYPQFTLSGQATWQTDVTSIPIDLSAFGFDIPTIPKDQYKAVVELNQTIWDGGAVKAQKQMIRAEHEVSRKEQEVNMYDVRQRINDLFFGVLLIDEQLKLNIIYNDELLKNEEKVAAYIEYGVANQADMDAVTAEILTVAQNRAELLAARKAYADMLAYFIGEPLGETVVLEKPGVPVISGDTQDPYSWQARPELRLFEANIDYLKAQRKALNARDMPKIGAFVQGGYGNPALNMFEDKFKAFAVVGVSLQWNFGGLYTRKNDLRKIDTAVRQVGVQRDVFDFNNRLQSTRQKEDIGKYAKILSEDDRIIMLRGNIKRASEAKVENGTMSVNDLVRDISAEQTALQNRALHEMEMIKSSYDLKNTLNQ